MKGNTSNTSKWAIYYKAHKELWHNPAISPYVKCFIRLLELHRGDSNGWSLSIRIVSKYLGVAPNTARKIINQAIKEGLVEPNTIRERKRRKLRLSESLRAPVEKSQQTSETFFHQMIQPTSWSDTESESPNESVNNKEKDINANTEKSQVKPKEKIEESNPYKEEVYQSFSDKNVPRKSAGLEQLREVVERMRKQ